MNKLDKYKYFKEADNQLTNGFHSLICLAEMYRKGGKQLKNQIKTIQKTVKNAR